MVCTDIHVCLHESSQNSPFKMFCFVYVRTGRVEVMVGLCSFPSQNSSTICVLYLDTRQWKNLRLLERLPIDYNNTSIIRTVMPVFGLKKNSLNGGVVTLPSSNIE